MKKLIWLLTVAITMSFCSTKKNNREEIKQNPNHPDCKETKLLQYDLLTKLDPGDPRSDSLMRGFKIKHAAANLRTIHYDGFKPGYAQILTVVFTEYDHPKFDSIMAIDGRLSLPQGKRSIRMQFFGEPVSELPAKHMTSTKFSLSRRATPSSKQVAINAWNGERLCHFTVLYPTEFEGEAVIHSTQDSTACGSIRFKGQGKYKDFKFESTFNVKLYKKEF